MRENYITIGELRKIIADLPSDATIGFTNYDEDGDAWGYSEFKIIENKKLELKYGEKNLDYYID